MFPYLKSKKEFLWDCENPSFHFEINPDNQNQILLVENTNDNNGSYGNTRGCDYNNPLCKGNCSKIRCSHLLNCYDYLHPNTIPNIECNSLSNLIALLSEALNKSNWGADLPHGVGSVSLSTIQSWCQSLGIYVHDVVKKIHREDVVIGLEYYVENTVNERARVDVIIAGYGNDGRGKLFIIETKQNDNDHYDANDPEDAEEQVMSYYTSIRRSIYNFDDLFIDIYPIVYFHNYVEDNVAYNHEYQGNNIFICNGGIDGIDRMADYINEILGNNPEGNPKEIIRELKRNISTFSVHDIADIMYGRFDYDMAINSLRPDQRNAFNAMKESIEANGNNGITQIINGASGSGKTLIAALLIRYCIDNQKLVAFIFQASAPVTGIIKKCVFQYIIDDINESDIPDVVKQDLCQQINEYRFNILLSQENFLDIIEQSNVSERVKNWFRYTFLLYVEYSDIIFLERDPDAPNVKLLIFDEFHRFGNDFDRLDPDNEEYGRIYRIERLICMSDNRTFLIDPLQEISRKDSGNAALSKIREAREVEDFKLWSLFRCNKCDGYLSWIDQVLQIGNDADRVVVRNHHSAENFIYLSDLDYEVDLLEVVDDDTQMELINGDVIPLSEDRQAIRDLFNCFIEDFHNGNTNRGFITQRNDDNRINIGDVYDVQGL
ncbi:MAG: DUF2075 domain-containing protein [Lachnospiraceae bacterium]|nr:DUF2075 domain-containing protein [Lachnospiraceae bacterium]